MSNYRASNNMYYALLCAIKQICAIPFVKLAVVDTTIEYKIKFP